MGNAVNKKNIKRNSYGFSFVDKLASFVNNFQFRRGHDLMKEFPENETRKTYIWNVLSAIGEDYAEIVYENVVNYLDNVGNVDLCKVKALQSMIRILGVKYEILDSFNAIPVEIANLMDVLTVNKSYLLNSVAFRETFAGELSAAEEKNPIQKFDDSFYGELSAAGCFETAESCDFSDELSGKLFDECEDRRIVVNEENYEKFLYNLYYSVLTSFVYMKYADQEEDIGAASRAGFQYIYENIIDELVGNTRNYDQYEKTAHEREIQELKNKYAVSNFREAEIVDDIEKDLDSLDNYGEYERKILELEISHRKDPYRVSPGSGERRTQPEDISVGLEYNLSRHSYYREKKVKEYFQFIENTYQNLTLKDKLLRSLKDEAETTIKTYEKDGNYFVVEQKTEDRLLNVDDYGEYYVNNAFLHEIANLLVKQTEEIADIREQLKTQMQKNYVRGTFLLVSYVVNEYLKRNIAEKDYGEIESKHGEKLRDVMEDAYKKQGSVELVEYYDDTEYYNITTKNDSRLSDVGSVNEKFWDNQVRKMGVDSNDLELEEIENFYKNVLNLKKNQVDDVIDFLSAVYEYGANNSFVDGTTGEFNCYIKGNRLIGDIDREIGRIRENMLSIEKINEDVKKYTDAGYVIPENESVGDQVKDLSDYLSTYYHDQIVEFNEETVNDILMKNVETLQELKFKNAEFDAVSANYEKLFENTKYRHFLDQYEELERAYLKQKMDNFDLSCRDGILWTVSAYDEKVENLRAGYLDLCCNLYENLMTLSVWPEHYWPYYVPKYDDELTSVTDALNTYLASEAKTVESEAKQHLQNHYDKMLTYKTQMLTVLENCMAASDRFQAFKDQIAIATKTSLDESHCETLDCWGDSADAVSCIKITEKDEWGYEYVYGEYEVVSVGVFSLIEKKTFSYPAVDENDSITEQFAALLERCNFPDFKYALEQRDNYLGIDESVHSEIYPASREEKFFQGYHYEDYYDPETGKADPKKVWDE